MFAKLSLTAALPALALLGACSDDLESRQAAVGDQGPVESVERGNAKMSRAPANEAASAAPVDASAASEESIETEVVDASSDDLMDRATGFNANGISPTPIDNAAGFDPTPLPPENFGED